MPQYMHNQEIDLYLIDVHVHATDSSYKYGIITRLWTEIGYYSPVKGTRNCATVRNQYPGRPKAAVTISCRMGGGGGGGGGI